MRVWLKHKIPNSTTFGPPKVGGTCFCSREEIAPVVDASVRGGSVGLRFTFFGFGVSKVLHVNP